MVSFTCNACGQTVKKNQVEKHYQSQCHACNVLSCIDCGKDFVGDTYVSHNSCITEAEKYQGHLYKAKEKGNKGDAKQKEWLQKVRDASSAVSDPKLQGYLDKIAEYSNVPRKKKKFENFCRNSIRIFDQKTLDLVWQAFMGEDNKPQENGDCKPDRETSALEAQEIGVGSTVSRLEEPESRPDSGTASKTGQVDSENIPPLENGHVESEGKKRKRKKNMEYVDSASLEIDKQEEDTRQKLSKKEKRRMRAVENEAEQLEMPVTKKKKRRVEADVDALSGIAREDSVDTECAAALDKGKFHWHRAIKRALKEATDNQLPVKKLRKKVMAAYQEHGTDHRTSTMEECRALFDSKLKTYPKVKIAKDMVSLKR